MKSLPSNFVSNMLTLVFLAAVGIFLAGCAHEVKKIKSVASLPPVSINASANPGEEITLQQELINKAYASHVDVLAPEHFSESKRFLLQATSENQKGAAGEEVLKSVGLAKAHLNKASADAAVLRESNAEVINAREQALKAGARKYPAQLVELDRQLNQLTPEKKTTLQADYISLELFCIKDTKLGITKTVLDQARVKNAAKITPIAFNQAIQKYNIAEKLIETDRHSDKKINLAVTSANQAANRITNLLISEQTSRSQTPEQRAVTLENRDLALKQADSTISEVAAIAIQKNQELAKQNENLAISEYENKDLKQKELDDKIVADAAALFTKDEADVYRQEGLLIIRLKSMNFASGRSDLPSESIAVLNKVKEVLIDLGPGQVTVQGHTDGIGSAVINQKLSQSRAQSVMKYFSSDKVFENQQIDSIGYGYTKPLATNKTKEGRAQNRRVDIVIKTTQAI